MSWKVLITARTITEVGTRALEILRSAGCDVIIPPKLGPLPADEILKLLPGVDAALVSPDGYNAAVLASPEAARLKIISRWGVGYDSINIPAATKQGIVVAYTPGMLDDTVADYTWALLLGIARRIHEGHMGMAAGKWAPAWGHDVFGKTLGVIGCGRIGQAVVRRAAGFNLRVLSYDVASNPKDRKSTRLNSSHT